MSQHQLHLIVKIGAPEYSRPYEKMFEQTFCLPQFYPGFDRNPSSAAVSHSSG
jgi:hypothetical protein